MFRSAGVDPERHIVDIPWQPRPRFYGILRQADAFLDTIGFSGFNTAMQAVDCALPVVTMEGQFMRGRFASAILKRIGLEELVHSSVAAYVDTAARLASDPGHRDALRGAIAAGRPVLYKDEAPIRALEQSLSQLCRGDGALQQA